MEIKSLRANIRQLPPNSCSINVYYSLLGLYPGHERAPQVFFCLQRLYNLKEDNMERIRNKRYLRASFLVPITIIGLFVLGMFLFALQD